MTGGGRPPTQLGADKAHGVSAEGKVRLSVSVLQSSVPPPAQAALVS